MYDIYCSGERALDNIDEDSQTASEALLMSVLQKVIQTNMDINQSCTRWIIYNIINNI